MVEELTVAMQLEQAPFPALAHVSLLGKSARLDEFVTHGVLCASPETNKSISQGDPVP